MEFVEKKKAVLQTHLKTHLNLLENGDTSNSFTDLLKMLKAELCLDKWFEKNIPIVVYELYRNDKELFNNGFFTVCEEVDKILPSSSQTLNVIYQVLNIILEDMIPIVRLYYFHDLVEYYYEILRHEMDGNNIDITKILSPYSYGRCVKLLLPFVKIQHLKNDKEKIKYNNVDYTVIFENLLSELKEYFTYPSMLREDCYKILNKKLKTTDFELKKFCLKSHNGPRGFIGEYFKLQIYYKHENMDKVLPCFVKFKLSSGQLFEDMADEAFKKEEFFYKIFLPRLHDCGLSSIISCSPECYFIRADECLVLEDLALSGFSSNDMQNILEYRELSIIIKQLAHFHACSIIFEETQTETNKKLYRLNEEYEKYLLDIHFSEEKWGSINKCSAKSIYQFLLLQFENIPKKITMEEFVKRVECLYNSLHENLKSSGKYRNVICHSDLWLGNIMFNSQENEISCKLIDFQLIRYCPPAIDLWFLLFTNTNKNIRQAYTNKLFSEYYEHLHNILNTFKVDLQDIYSETLFSKSMKEFKITALCLSLGYVSVLCCPKNVLPISTPENLSAALRFLLVDRSEVLGKALNDKCYNLRIRDLVEDLYLLCEENIG